MPTTTQLREQADARKERYKRDIADVYSDALPPDLEKIQLGEIYVAAQADMRALAEQFKQADALEQAASRGRAFGADDLRQPGSDPSMHAVAFRDAQDRADALENPGQAQRLLARALGSGDDLLARAVAAQSVRKGWTEVVDEYELQHPGYRERAAEAQLAERTMKLAQGIIFSVRKPSELTGVGDVAAPPVPASRPAPGTPTPGATDHP